MAVQPNDIRNVVLLGHSGCGKTTFAETMLFEAGAIQRRGKVEDGSTVSDYSDIEKSRGSSVFCTLLHASWRNIKINIIDTPGSDDLIGDIVSSMKVADTALMILNARSGVEVGTELLWEYVEKFQTPCLFIINQIEHEKADFEATLEQAKNRFGSKVLPFQFPVADQGGIAIVDALRMVMYLFKGEGGKPEKMPIPNTYIGRAQEMHNALVEAAAENDEGLMEIFFDSGALNEEELTKGLNIALAKQQIFPVFCASALSNMGSGRIMGFINDICPSPAERPPSLLEDGSLLACNVTDKTSIFIYKTISEPQVGNVSYFKVFSGSLSAGDELMNAENASIERFNHIYITNGKSRESIDKLVSGDLGVTVKLKDSHTNNTLSPKGTSRKIKKIDFPEPRFRTAVNPPNKNEIEKLARALHLAHEEDPTLIVEHSQELKQTILHGQGQLHLDIVKYRLEHLFDIKLDFIQPKIPYRETITKEANEVYRHKKQSGGAGQFAEVHMRIEPWHDGIPDPHGLSVRHVEIEELPSGGRLVYLWSIVGGSIDSRFSNAIKKGIMQKMEEGPMTGSPCRDIRVCIFDGKMHPVDSNDMAFQIAGSLAFKNAFAHAGGQILEPIYDLNVLCQPEVMGDVMGDLQTRRAIITGMDSEGHYQKISAKVPLAELYGYSSTLRSLTQGKAKFNRKFADYAQVPSEIQQKLKDDYSRHASDEG